ncbi:Odorant receptor 13 [Cephus cinctus]|nr:Odorant receptor 13 [Cephus cinctus]
MLKKHIASSDLKYVINWIRISLKVVGLWPNSVDEMNWLSQYGFLIVSFLILVVISTPQIISLIMVWPDLNLMMKNLVLLNVPVTTSMIKCFIFGFSKQDVRPIVDLVVAAWMRPKSDQERALMMKYATIAKIIYVPFSIAAYASILVNVAIPFVVYQRAENISDYINEPFFQTVIIYNIQNSPIFELTCIVVVIMITLACTAYTVIDGFLAMSVLHLCCQFTNLRNELKSVMTEATMNDGNQFLEKIGLIVKRHNELIGFSKRVASSYAWTLLVQMTASMLECCFFGFGFIWVFQNDQSSIAETVFLICAIFVAFAGLYGYCYVSELLCSENEAIGDTVYDSCWYNLSPKDARCLLFIISGSRKQLFVTAANFCYYSHSLFAAILKTLLGYISILMSISE